MATIAQHVQRNWNSSVNVIHFIQPHRLHAQAIFNGTAYEPTEYEAQNDEKKKKKLKLNKRDHDTRKPETVFFFSFVHKTYKEKKKS